MDITISPNLLSGRVTAIASKSEAHRLLICAALADTACTITIAEINEDVAATISCLRELGAKITFMGQNSLLVSPIILSERPTQCLRQYIRHAHTI